MDTKECIKTRLVDNSLAIKTFDFNKMDYIVWCHGIKQLPDVRDVIINCI